MKLMIFIGGAALSAAPLSAQDTGVRYGPVFEDFGPHLSVEGIGDVPADREFAHSFDVARKAPDGKRNSSFESAARFMNMHAAHGVDPENMRLAVVVHGSAVEDLLDGEDNASAVMVREMLDAGVRFIVCGQSAVGQGIAQEDLIPGVEMALSAMTAHALLQQRGYTLNPF